MQNMKDSVSTSVSINLFENKQSAHLAHILKSKLFEIPLSIFSNNEIENFNSDRLKDSPVNAYPLNDRPRGNADITSVEYHQNQIKQQSIVDINPIWLLYKNKKYILLDGAHRIVASYIEGVEFIRACVIYI